MLDFDDILNCVANQNILCVGDVMLDDFIYGDVTRISPEAPTPVLAVKHSEIQIGGAGNVARNVATLGARCVFVSLIGNDDPGLALSNAFAKFEGAIVADLVVDTRRQTTRKVRFVSEHHSAHLMRADWETVDAVSPESESAIIAYSELSLPNVNAVILSDYAKGVLTGRVVRAIIDAARRLGKPVVVDPKHHDYRIYRGATLLTPNLKELSAAAHRPLTSDAEIASAAAELARLTDSVAILVKRGEQGMTLYAEGQTPLHIPAYPVKIRDVSGAGDTVAAVMAVMLAMNVPFESAMRAANAAAAVAVGKRGTSTVSLAELRHRLLPTALLAPENKVVFDLSVLDQQLSKWRQNGLRIGFANGCFDLLHRGHIRLLVEARSACDRLVVGLNGDTSARRLKGTTRPINSAVDRADVLAALEAVDLVVVFDDDTPLALIDRVRPAVLVKGADSPREEVAGADVVEASGGKVLLVGLIPGQSTAAIMARAGRQVSNA
jgi:D-beta-D-heptose 7-phosphate kinase / D-beta-D-heptose 1-phosphate adenosyltransferase